MSMQLQWTDSSQLPDLAENFPSGSISIDLLFGSKNEVWEDGRTGFSFPCMDQLKVIVRVWPVSPLSKVVLEYGVHRDVRHDAGARELADSGERCHVRTTPLVLFDLHCFWKS